MIQPRPPLNKNKRDRMGSNTRYLKNALALVALACLGIVVGLLLVEALLHFVPIDRLDSWVEGSTRRQLYRLDPRIGWALQPNARTTHITRDDEVIQVETNSKGLRDDEHEYEKPAQVYRILILGDSFAEALDVPHVESFPYLVEQCLSQHLQTEVEIINGGVAGYGTAEQYLFYTYEGNKYNPDLVLLVAYPGNDLHDLARNDEHRLIRGFGGYRFSLDGDQLSQTWISWEEPYNEQLSPLQQVLRRYSRLYRIVNHPESKIKWQLDEWRQGARNQSQPNAVQNSEARRPIPWDMYSHVQDFPNNPIAPPQLKEVWSLFQVVVRQLETAVKADEGDFAVVIIPTEYQVHPTIREQTISNFSNIYEGTDSFEREWDISEPNLTMLTYLEGQAIQTLDLLPYFQAHDEAGGGLIYFDGGIPQHLNRDGQRLMSDIMCDWLIRNESIPLPRAPNDG